MTGSELLFRAADATWRSEAARVLRREETDLGLALLPEARGEPGTLLRAAFDVRERAYATWRRGKVEARISETGSVIPFPSARATEPARRFGVRGR